MFDPLAALHDGRIRALTPQASSSNGVVDGF
jgi:hypothetical protein